MIKRVGIWLGFCLLFCSGVFAQSDAGKIKGTVKDESGEPVEFATVVIISNGIIKGGANTNAQGEFSIAPVEPGLYEVRASFAGNTINASGINVAANKTVDVPLAIETGVELKEVQITETIPIDNTTTGGSISGADVKNIGLRNINTLAAIVPGVYQADDGDGLSMRGGRSSSTVYFVDGVKVRGTLNLPQKSIGQLTVITGGTPAEYGDVIGGIISVTTSSPSYEVTGGAEYLTSQFLDPYGYHLGGLNLSGPIISKYIDSIDYNKPILGFFIAGEYQYEKDQDPAQGGVFKLTDEAYQDFQENPLTLDRTGNFFLNRGNFVTPDMVETSKFKLNNSGSTARINARLDFQPSENIIVKFGGGFSDVNSDSWSIGNSMFAPEANQLFHGRQYSGWGRFQQTFKTAEGSKVQNLFYQLQVDWSRYEREFMDANHKKNLFDYGYVGSFDFDRQEIYRYVDPIDNADIHNSDISSNGYYMTAGFSPINLTFDPSTSKNPLQANYNNFIFDYVAENGIVNPFTGIRDYSIRNLDFLSFYGGLRNGDGVDGIYSLYSGPGTSQGGYQKTSYDQARLTGQASAEIKGHAIKVGFEFEQRQERFWAVGNRALWQYMRQLTNRHLSGINQDPNSWELVMVNGQFQDTVHAPAFFEESDQSVFDRNLRNVLGLPMGGSDFIVVDNLDPSILNLRMFSADELLNDGNQYVNYYGYNFAGEKTKRVAAEDFFTDKQNRPMNAFAPTYISGFIQDKFELEDIIFNVGVRIDRFDANQKVLKDPFVLFPTYTAGEAKALGYNVNDGIPDNWVPYMDDATDPSQDGVLGYRDPEANIWYDANGTPVSSAALRSGGEVQPFLKDDEISIESFKDYTPQVIVMPRLSFSFPISGEAVFFAHYDVLAQRPGQTGAGSGSALAGQIAEYYFLQNSSTITVTNPNLRPERTIDYEVGFKQKLNDFMALSISAFYREMRDMLQITNFTDAYPTSYSTYSNIDFGTIKGFTFALNMIRMRNIRMSASYTMQFAAGTGSSFTSSRNALSAVDGFTAIRALLPLDFDQRHRVSGNIDYRFYGDDNKGPGITLGEKTLYPLSNAGANLTFYLGSGTPYSVNSLANSADVQGGINQNIQLSGTPNGSRLPWQLRFDAKVDKDFMMGGKAKLDAEGKEMSDGKGNTIRSKQVAFNVYLQVLNLLNTKNVLNVYKTSGLPTDDGYLSTGVGQQAINAAIDGDAFTYLYTLRMQNPGNYSLPRRIRLGVQINF
ncbi:MAG: TonB-dependent receptor [Bacteroidetes bacterium]|nr:TonB-dependent receptor [Bacteroidota bacterium]MBL0017094.1 TonB-dependent receptor [Bacteroidota bacterium]MBP6638763.1 TonB-dependent receptor [Bacteroidia bacterium]MBP6720941.1 TonB-dependent receptor [Bacteroidia bacterium]